MTNSEAAAHAATVLNLHLKYLRTVLTRGTGSVDERDGMFVCRSPAPLAFLVNGIARTDPSIEPQQVLRRGAEAFGKDGFEVICLDGRDDDLRAAAESAGYAIGGSEPLQRIDRLPEPFPADRSAFDVRLAETESDVGQIIAVAQDAHSVYGFDEEVFAEIFRVPASILAPDIHAVIVSEWDAPVASAQAYVSDGTVYIGWVCVARAAMRRGLGRLATEAAIKAGFDRGATEAVLMASPMGAPLYRAMGFTDVGALRNAQAPGAA